MDDLCSCLSYTFYSSKSIMGDPDRSRINYRRTDDTNTEMQQIINLRNNCESDAVCSGKIIDELLSTSGESNTFETHQSADESADEDEETETDCQDSDLKYMMYGLESESSQQASRGYNKTFSEEQIREIEHKNAVLMKKILSHNRRQSQFAPSFVACKATSSSINRKKQQRQIDHDNLILLKKIQTVKPFGQSQLRK